MTAENKSNPIALAVPFPWLTVETAVWGLVLLLALGLRLLRLDVAPLSAGEAQGALAAWRFAGGQGAPTATNFSPILFSGQWLTFLFFGANELSARLLPALAGSALALAPALLRRHIGRSGALLAGALLALSPTAVTLSRTACGDVLVALGALLCASGLWHFVTGQQVSEPANQPTNEPANQQTNQHTTPILNTQYLIPILSTLGLALMLTSSPLAYSALLALGAALLVLILTDSKSWEQLQNAWCAFHSTPNLPRYTLGTLVSAFVLLSTTFTWHIGGLGAAADLLPQWLDGFVRWPDSLSFGYPFLILFFYEALLLLTGGIGITLAFLRADIVARFFALWSVSALVLTLIRPGHGPGDVLLVLVPLACLGGLALHALIEGLRRWGHWLNEGPYLVISAPLWAYLAINLAIYASRPGEYNQLNLLLVTFSLPTYLSLTLLSVFLLLMMAAVLSVAQGSGPTLRGLGLSATLALSLVTIAATWGVSQNRPSDPREPLILAPTATEIQLLKDTLNRLSNERLGGDYAIDVTVLGDDPALMWALRDFRQASFTDAPETPLLSSAIVAPQVLGAPQVGEGYVGQSFPLRRRWQTDHLACQWYLAQLETEQVRQLDCSALARWLVFRRSPDEPLEERVVLWLRRDLTEQ
jgi:4-amino-4-deoxy-L-arabinose transferase-like glycosyltransferase